MDNYIVCGMQFGDEGKGTFVDYLTHKYNAKCIVKYNGGSQASHTVITPEGILHKFSQLGSGMFFNQCHTFLSENMVINLDNLVNEMQVFCEKTGFSFSELRDRIHIHENCLVVTPYHKLANKLREFSMGSNRRGTVGTGVSEVMYILSLSEKTSSNIPLALRVRDIYNTNNNSQVFSILHALKEYVSNFYFENKDTIWKNVPDSMKVPLFNELSFLLDDKSCFVVSSRYIQNATSEISFKSCIYSDNLIDEDCTIIFEGSQGLLIDRKYGIKPNTTFLDTTNGFASNICQSTDIVHNIGIAKAFSSRHGLGLFPTEDIQMSKIVSDENQEETFWNGRIRFGWFDAVLLKYAQLINKVDTLYLSSLDKLSNFKKIKVCCAYLYTGFIDSNFEKSFEYTIKPNGLIYITAIKDPNVDLGKYLKNCSPLYVCVDGWRTSISEVSDVCELPEKCIQYIHLLEALSGIPISVVSVGPTRKNKIDIPKER